MSPRIKPLIQRHKAHPGFTLIITISLLVLLMIVAVGVLSLSAITLRQSNQGQAIAEARANARLALMMAIGDLQKTMGPDRAISAPAPSSSNTSSRPLTGAWESWAPAPSESAPDYQSSKDSRFRQWLVSHPVPETTRQKGFPNTLPRNPVNIHHSTETNISAERVMLDTKGAYAWHISDESQKARIDLLRNPAPSTGLAERRALVAGQRPYFKLLNGQDGFNFVNFPSDTTEPQFQQSRQTQAKLTSLDQAELIGGDLPEHLRQDLTTHSLGVLTDVRNGGLKRDLSTAFSLSGGLPTELANQKLYQSTHGFTGVSDPFWSVLSEYHNVYRQLNANTAPSYQVPSPESVRVDRHLVPRKYIAAPVIQKFDLMLSVVARDAHGPHIANLNRIDPQRKYMVHMVLLPVITLHNPYNSEITFDRLNIVIGDVPVGLNFFINGQPQNNRFVPLNDFWIGTGANNGRGTKAMRYDLADWQYPGETTPSNPVRMRPGQTMVFGPYMDPAASSAQTLRGNWGTREELVTAENRGMKLRPGFSGKAVGLSYDFLAPNAYRLPSAAAASAAQPTTGAVALRWSDRFHVETTIIRPEIGVQTEWDISARLVVGGREVEYGGLRFVYQDQPTLDRYFREVWRYPAQGSIATEEFYEPYTKPLKDQTRSKVIAMFSTTARTASGGVYEHNRREPMAGALNVRRDGRLTGKPFVHHNPARQAVLVNLQRDIIGHHSHEMNFQSLNGETDDMLEIDAFQRGPALTGNTTARGIKSGALFDLPQGPMQSIADFRRSNAINSTYLPNPVQPIANSWVPPMMDTSSTNQAGITTYALLDHSYLANHALYDGYYFSTIAQRGTSSPRDEFVNFMEGRRPLLNQAFQPWRPSGANANTFFTSAAPAQNAWKETASWQMVRGSFNVNSTSVLAWKAMLSSLGDTPIPVQWAKSLAIESVAAAGVPIPAMHMSLAGPAEAAAPDLRKIDNKRANQWNGFRSLDSYEMDRLVQMIVQEVRTRGPFLSMSEFVNRRLGYNSELTRVGALQAAIDKSTVNDAVFADILKVNAPDVANGAIYGYRTPEVSVGNPAEGAPGTICQGDLMHILEPRATVRGDTFLIRTAGQSIDGNGKVLATAHLEAVLQRVPDFVDPGDTAAKPIAQLNATNALFGRRFQIVSLRWLNPLAI